MKRGRAKAAGPKNEKPEKRRKSGVGAPPQAVQEGAGETARSMEQPRGFASAQERQVQLMFEQVEGFVEQDNGAAEGSLIQTHLQLLETAFGLALKNDQLEQVMERYILLRAELNRMDTGGQTTGQAVATLSKEELPTFGGDFAEWPAFEDAFRIEVADKRNLSEPMKLRKLKLCLKGEAKDLIEKFGLHEQGAYRQAWELLRTHYSNSFEAFSTHIARIFQARPVKRGDAEEGRRVIGTIEAGVRKAVQIVPGDNLAFASAVHLINQMDADTREQWKLAREDESVVPTLDQVTKFFLRKIKTWEEAAPVAKAKGVQEAIQGDNAGRSRGSDAANRGGCFRCGAGHRVRFCPVLERDPPAKRKEWARQRGVCEHCLLRHPEGLCKWKGVESNASLAPKRA